MAESYSGILLSLNRIAEQQDKINNQIPKLTDKIVTEPIVQPTANDNVKQADFLQLK